MVATTPRERRGSSERRTAIPEQILETTKGRPAKALPVPQPVCVCGEEVGWVGGVSIGQPSAVARLGRAIHQEIQRVVSGPCAKEIR